MVKHDGPDALHIRENRGYRAPRGPRELTSTAVQIARRLLGPDALQDPYPRADQLLNGLLPTWTRPETGWVRPIDQRQAFLNALRDPVACEIVATTLEHRWGVTA